MNVVAVPNNLKETELAELVRAGDAAFEGTLRMLAEEILSLQDVRLLGLTGPTCSGKTTAAAMLTKELEANGRAVHIISVDDFYHSKETLQRIASEKGREDPDYDSPDTIDLDFMRTCTLSLLSGRETAMPRFNFRTGQREQGMCSFLRASSSFIPRLTRSCGRRDISTSASARRPQSKRAGSGSFRMKSVFCADWCGI